MLRKSIARQVFTIVLSLIFGFTVSAKTSETTGDNHEQTEEKAFNAKEMILHHIADAHDWHFWDVTDEDGVKHPVSLPLPVIVSHNGQLDVFLSSAFHHGETPVTKGNNTYVLHHGEIYVAKDETGELTYDDQHHPINAKALDLSMTKNVVSMLFSIALLLLIFISVGRSYKKNGGIPRGLAGVIEPLVLFVRDDIARPNIGEEKYKRFLPFLLTVFLPPVPWPMWFIMIPVEIIGIFTKPFALMVRLFANITAGHILILSLVSLIFIFKSVAMSALSIPFMVFMNVLELLVAALQAYIFTLLSALFIGMATEEAHH